MRIVCISDTHNLHADLKLPPGDVLVHTGDLTSRGRAREVAAFLDWFAAQPHPHKLFIAGNHDFLFERSVSEARALVSPGVIYLEDEGVTVNGLRFWGSPVTPPFQGWAFNRTTAEIRSHWARIPDDVDVLLTHGPARGVRDALRPNAEHVGCPELRRELDTRLHPRLHVFGHIHEGYGVQQGGERISVNASVLDHRYRLLNDPVVVTL
jgi:Icc-related predicted phosphoesterase